MVNNYRDLNPHLHRIEIAILDHIHKCHHLIQLLSTDALFMAESEAFHFHAKMLGEQLMHVALTRQKGCDVHR